MNFYIWNNLCFKLNVKVTFIYVRNGTEFNVILHIQNYVFMYESHTIMYMCATKSRGDRQEMLSNGTEEARYYIG